MEQHVGDLMDQRVTVIERSRDLDDAEGIMLREQLHSLPVVDETGRIVGLIGRTDLLTWRAKASHAAQNSPENEPISARIDDAMSPVVHCIRPDRPVMEAAARMIREQVNRLIVVDEAYRVVGILTANALLRSVPDIAKSLGGESLTGT